MKKASTKVVNTIGWIASIIALLMYFSYLDQIHRNLEGVKGSLVLAVVSTINCICWVLYAGLKDKRDWPIIVCNVVGMIFAFIMTITSF